LALLACSHTPPPPVPVVEVPNWLWWGRGSEGAKIQYPEDAWNASVEGDAAVEVCLDRKGATQQTRAVAGPQALADAAARAVATWRFDPVEKEGEKIAACFQRKFRFRKQPEPELFFKTDADTIVTRGYDAPLPEYRPPVPPLPGATGDVYVRLCGEADGKMRDITILEAPSPQAKEHVKHAVAIWRYRPAKLRGEPIPACLVERVRLQ
jgi:outer membrane biosynthesis protein TonB